MFPVTFAYLIVLSAFCLSLYEAGSAAYYIRVFTSHWQWTSTDADVRINIYGSKGSTSARYVDNLDHNDFQRHGVDTFLICEKDVGDLEKIKIEKSQGDGDWRLDKVEITKEKTKSGQRNFATFECHCWLNDRTTHAYVSCS